MTVDESSPPPPRAYHPLTGEPLNGLLYVSLTAPAMPAPPLPPAESSSKSKGKEKAVAPLSPPCLLLSVVVPRAINGLHLVQAGVVARPPSLPRCFWK